MNKRPVDYAMERLAREDTEAGFRLYMFRENSSRANERLCPCSSRRNVDWPEESYVSQSDDAETVRELLRDLMRWIYRTLEKEHDYLMSDEAVDESIVANEYEFTEDGERY